MAEPSTDLLGSVIGQLAQHPELLRGVLGMLGGGPGPAVTPTEGAKEDAALPDAPDEEGAEAERRP
ncbi:MAG: hypothetical protein J6125_04735, partial [Clostridia bacterium]|nr:hypothetical protein [Clostridia bacterium]